MRSHLRFRLASQLDAGLVLMNTRALCLGLTGARNGTGIGPRTHRWFLLPCYGHGPYGSRVLLSDDPPPSDSCRKTIFFNFVESLCKRFVWRYRPQAGSTLILMLIDCFEHYESSVDVYSFQASFPNPRRQMNAGNFCGAALVYVADQAIPKVHAGSH